VVTAFDAESRAVFKGFAAERRAEDGKGVDMPSLVSADDNPRVRVVPRIFPELPTQEEFRALRKSRNSLAVYLVLLIGMLIASVAALVYLSLPTLTSSAGDQGRLDEERRQLIADLRLNPAPAAGDLDNVIMTRITALETSNQELTQQNTMLQEQVRQLGILEEEYRTIHTRRQDIGRLKGEIAQLLQMEVYRTSGVPHPLYDGQPMAWMETVEGNLLTYREGLEREKQALLNFRALPAGTTLTPVTNPTLPR
jgi:hypothetical protein